MCMNIYRNIDRSKVQFDFVKHTSEIGDYEDEITSLGGRIFDCPRYSIHNHFTYCRWWKSFLCQHDEYQIIHGHYYTFSAVYFKIAKKLGRTTIAHSHSISCSNHFLQLYIDKIEKYSDYCFACSDAAGKWMFKHKDYKVINNAIDLDKFRFNQELRNKTRVKLGIDGCLVVGTVANYSEAKNPLGLIDIFSEIKKERPNSYLLWVGYGYMKDKILNRIREKKLEDSVILTGKQTDVSQFLQAMDVFLLPSHYEGLPVSLIEAQAAGLPCVCSDKVTRDADITDNCNFLPLEDVEEWISEILKLSKRDRIIEDNKIIEAGYSIKDSAVCLQDFYLRIVNA